MAKVKFSPSVLQVRGHIGNWVYRKYGDRSIIAVPGDTEGKPPTPAQLAFRDQFLAATRYAKSALADPVLGPAYQRAAKAQDLPPQAFIVGEFFTPPKVTAIATAGYHGHVGDVLVVNTEARFEATGAQVTIRNAANAVLEQGAAARAEDTWRYVATTAVANGTAVTIEAVATDHPGHTGDLTVPCNVA